MMNDKQVKKKHELYMKNRVSIKDAIELAKYVARLKSDKNHVNKVAKRLNFSESFGVNTNLLEHINYNENTGNISYSSTFASTNGYVLPRIDI